MNTRTTLALFLLSSVVVAAMLWGSSLWAFVNAPSAALVLGISLGGTLCVSSGTDLIESLWDWLANEDLDEAGRERAHRIFTHLADFTVAGGVVGVLIGLIQMLRNLADPTAIGPSMAVALLSMLYAVLFGEILLRAMAEDCRHRGKGTAV